MTATRLMIVAILLGVVGRWANNQQALPPAKGVLQVIGAVALIAVLDNGVTEPVARGFAWLFLAAVLLSDNSPLTGLSKAEGLVGGTAGNGSNLYRNK